MIEEIISDLIKAFKHLDLTYFKEIPISKNLPSCLGHCNMLKYLRDLLAGQVSYEEWSAIDVIAKDALNSMS